MFVIYYLSTLHCQLHNKYIHLSLGLIFAEQYFMLVGTIVQVDLNSWTDIPVEYSIDPSRSLHLVLTSWY